VGVKFEDPKTTCSAAALRDSSPRGMRLPESVARSDQRWRITPPWLALPESRRVSDSPETTVANVPRQKSDLEFRFSSPPKVNRFGSLGIVDCQVFGGSEAYRHGNRSRKLRKFFGRRPSLLGSHLGQASSRKKVGSNFGLPRGLAIEAQKKDPTVPGRQDRLHKQWTLRRGPAA